MEKLNHHPHDRNPFGNKVRFSELRPLHQVKESDDDVYAVDESGAIYMRKVRFDRHHQPIVEWVLFEGGGYCQLASVAYQELLNDAFDGDPRIAAAAIASVVGRNPEER